MCGRQGRQDKIVSRPKLFRLEVEVDLRVILHSLQHHFWWIKNVRTKMFRGRLGGPLTVLHPESVTTTPLSTIWNNAFFTAAPFSFFPFLLFPFPFSFFFSFFLFSAPFSSFSFLPFTSFVHNLQSRSFEITYLHFSRIGSIFFILYQFLLCLMDVAKKIVIFLFRFSLFPSRICIGRAWLFFSHRLTSFSPLFLIWNRKCFISFSSKPTTANMALLCFLSSGFFDNSKSFISDVH